ncbi:MAG: helix-turn-helix domain-containing protein [Haloarculaceae archaeon]
MRYVRLRARPTEGEGFHPLGERLSTEPAVERGKIYRVDLLADGTGVLLAEARGDRDRYRAILESSEHVIDFSIAGGTADGWWYSYTHFEPTEVTERMLAVRYDRGLAMEMPIEVEPGGSMVVTLVGPEGAFAEAMRADAPGYELKVLETGEHTPDLDDLFLSLTERQREVLEVAVDLGYYEDPRAATHEDVASEVDAAPSTVGEHLRKVESRVFAQLVR